MRRLARPLLIAGPLLALAIACSPATEAAPQLANASAPAAPCPAGPAVEQARDPARIASVTRITGPLEGRVVDRAAILDALQESALASRSERLEAATTDQLVVVTVPELGGLTIDEFGLTLGNHWGIGRADLNNGVLLLVAPSERKVRIEVGCGLETVLTDEGAARIIQLMLPAMREGDYVRGIDIGLREIDAVLRASPERRHDT